MRDLKEVELRPIRFHKLYNPFNTAIEQFDQYKVRAKKPIVQLKKIHTDMNIYDVQVVLADEGLKGRCNGPSYEHNRDGVCKHVYIVAFRTIQQWLKDREPKGFHFIERNVICNDIEALLTVPSIDKAKLRQAHAIFMDIVAADLKIEAADSKTGDECDDEFVKISKDMAEKWDKDIQSRRDGPKEDEWETADKFADNLHKDIEKEPLATPGDLTPHLPGITVKVNTKALQKKDSFPAAFGGTVKDIPKNLVTTLHGKPYVTVKGLCYAASRMGLKMIKSESVSWSWENEDGRAVFRATVIFADGREISGHGVAIPNGENVKKMMYPFIDHLAETRAIGRALRNALAFGEPAAEEMPTFEG